MATNRNDPGGSPDQGRRPPAGRRPARKSFEKDHATLWLLTVTLGLGLGTAARFIQRADAAAAATAVAAANAATASAQTVQATSSLPYQNQRVMVLPQQSYPARATTRMS